MYLINCYSEKYTSIFLIIKLYELAHNFTFNYSTDENATPYQIVRNSISTGKIKDILQLKQGFYEDLKECLEEEEDYADEPSSPKEVILQLMSNRFQSCSEESMQMKMILEKVGFDSQFAEDFSNHIQADPLDMSLWDWIHHFVVSTLDHLWMKCTEWEDGKPVTVERCYRGYGENARKKEFVKKDITENLKEGSAKNLLIILAEKIGCKNLDDIEFWYHGTTPAYANAIIWWGITLTQGKEFGNYSNNDGFYLTDDLNFAMRTTFQKYCIPGFSNNYTSQKEISVLVFAFEKKETENLFPLKMPRPAEPKSNPERKEIEIGIDLRRQKGASKELEKEKEERLRKVVHFFSHGAQPETEATFKKNNGLEPSYRDFIQFIVGPYTHNKGAEKKKDDIQIDWELTQLCLRKEEIKAKFEEIMNPVWLSVPIPEGYLNVMANNRHEQIQREKKHNPAYQLHSEDFIKYQVSISIFNFRFLIFEFQDFLF